MRKLLILSLFLFFTTSLAAQNNPLASRPYGQETVAFSATPAFNYATSYGKKIVLTGNVTSSTATGMEPGMYPTLEVCQDATGGRTFVPPTGFNGWVAIPSSANACIVEFLYYDGVQATVVTTATGGGGGSGTINSGTSGKIAIYSGSTTVSSDAKLDDGLTTANTLTYTDTGGMAAKSFNATGTGAAVVNGTNGACGAGVAGHSLLCLGDSLALTAKISLNGGAFLSIPQWSNDSPTPFGPLCADGTFPRLITVPIGSAGQPLLSTGSSSCFGYGALDLSSSSNVTNRLPKANMALTTVHTDQTNTFTAAGTIDLSAATSSAAFRIPNIAGASTTTNGTLAYNTTTNNFVGGMNSGNAIIPVTTITPTNNDCVKWVVTSGNFQLGDVGCGGTVSLSSLTAATTANTIANGNNGQTWQWSLTSAGGVGFKVTESSASTATGTPYLFQVSALSGSTANPARFDFNGNGVVVNTSGLLTSIGTGAIDATKLSGQISTSNLPSSSKMRTCAIIVGSDGGSALANTDIAPLGRQCFVPYAATVVEIEVAADGGTPNVIVAKNHAGTLTDLLSSALATAASGGIACSNSGGTAGLDGTTTCSATLQNTSLAAGDYIETHSATAGGTAKRMSIFITFTVN